jgi:hypothetical protein
VYRDKYRLVGAVTINAPKASAILRKNMNEMASFDDAVRSIEKFTVAA